MNPTEILERGAKHAQHAVELDQAGRKAEALSYYIIAIEHFLVGLKYCKIDSIRDAVQKKLPGYFSRAEQLKAALTVAAADKTRAGVGRKNEKDKSAAASPELSEESKALRQRLGQSVLKKEENKVTWDDIAGLENVKRALEEAAILPRRFPQLFKGKRKPIKSILLFGPPGTGKTHIAKALAHEADCTFFAVSASDLISKYMGDSEKAVKELFRMAQETKPSIIFFDEIDSILSKRSENEHEATRRVKNEFLQRMQEALDSDGLILIAATNRPGDLDSAVRRRFEKRVYVPLPDAQARQRLLELHTGAETVLSKEDLRRLSAKTAGFSGSDIRILSQEAVMMPVRELLAATHWRRLPRSSALEPCAPDAPGAFPMSLLDLEPEQIRVDPTRADHFDRALQLVKPSVSEADITHHAEFAKEFGEGIEQAHEAPPAAAFSSAPPALSSASSSPFSAPAPARVYGSSKQRPPRGKEERRREIAS